MPESPRPLVDYDSVSRSYDDRYARNNWSGVEENLLEFAGTEPQSMLEVGCGTGHWLQLLAGRGHAVVGLDRSRGMLSKISDPALRRECVCGTAEYLPFPDASFDRVYCINAIHHFPDAEAFVRQARRLLAPGGEILTLGLDPHLGRDIWPVYEYFGATLEVDRRRYPAAERIRAWMDAAGFDAPETKAVRHVSTRRSALDALERGAFAKTSTSQLILLSDEEYAAGIAAMRRAGEAAESRGETLILEIDLRLYSTRAKLSAS